MKVLSVAWVVQDEEVPNLKGILTGAGILIRNICAYIGKKEESYLLIAKCPMDEIQVGTIHYVANGLTTDQMNDNDKRLEVVINAFEQTIDKIQPDFVNLHGEGDFICECAKICLRRNVPFAVTIHLYVRKQLIITGYERAKEYWKDLFSIKGIPFITVGYGLRESILEDYPKIGKENIAVIQNGTNYIARFEKNSVAGKFENRKVLLLAGTINERKNQLQAIRAYEILPYTVKKNVCIVFCGKDANNGKLKKYIYENNLEDSIYYEGEVQSDEMYKYYSVADGYIMPSLAEGLSISQLEAIRYGIPLIMFSDSECARDINDDNVTILAETRDDIALADAIRLWYSKEWDRDYIREYSYQFTLERVADSYIEYYKRHNKDMKVISDLKGDCN